MVHLEDVKITSSELVIIDIPLASPYVSSQRWSGKTTTPRTLVRLRTDAGVEGIGETTGSPEVLALLQRFCEALVGHDPRDVGALRRRFLPNVYGNMEGRNGWVALAGVEMACWDLIGKLQEAPLWRVLGGKTRDRVPMAGLMGAFPFSANEGPDDLPAIMRDHGQVERVVDYARQMVAQHGFESLKIKSAGIDVSWDAAVLRALRAEFGPSMGLRLDPNAAFTVHQSLRLARMVADLGLEYLEDPTRGIDAMSRLRRDITIPLATNMCIIDFEQLPVGIRMGAVDVILGDVYHWGGVQGFMELAAVCKTFSLDMGVHSFVEAGVGTAVNLHLGAALPVMNHALDFMLHHQPDSITTEALTIDHGSIAVPDGVGLGVTLDEAAVDSLRVHTVRG